MQHQIIRARASRSAVTVAVIAAVTVLMSGCTNGSATAPVESTEDLIASLPAASGDVDTITWNLTTGEPDTLDPRNAATYGGGQVVGNLCDPLLRVDAEYNLSGNLAEFEQVTPTQLVYTVRDDARFWNGNPVTADDVAFSLERSKDPASATSFFYENVSAITVTAPNKVTVDFSTPDELFNNEMSTIAGMVVEKSFTEQSGEAFGSAAGGVMCSGPFQLESWTPGSGITITKNENYWNDAYTARAAEVDFTFVTDTTALTQALNSGEIDGAYELSPASYSALQSSEQGRLVFGPSTQSTRLDVARPDGPLADPKVREALQRMIDRNALAKVIYSGAATPLYSYVTPTSWPTEQSDAYQKAYTQLETARSFDLDAAKALVDESQYDGSDIVLAISSGDESFARIAQLIQQQGKSVGLNVTIETLQPLAFSQAQYDADKRSGYDLLLNSSFNGVQDPLEPIGFTYLPASFYNYTAYDEPAVTDALVQARQTFDAAERADLIISAQTEYETANASIPLVSNNTVTFLNNRLTGAVTSFAYWTMPQMALVGAAE